MLRALSLGFLSLVSQVWQADPPPDIIPYRPLAWQDAPVFEVNYQEDPQVQDIIDRYIGQLQSQGKDGDRQGVWIQSAWVKLGEHQGMKPLSAASLTKVATTLAALKQWSLEHQFETKIYTTGAISDGVLSGDLIVEGGSNPLFVWEEAIALGNALNQAGIRQVQGDLVVTGNFTMNYAVDPYVSAQTLRMGMDQRLWNGEVRQYHSWMEGGTAKPQVAIAGGVRKVESVPAEAQSLMVHKSLLLSEILKLMNIYSNNSIAEAIAQNLGGGATMGKEIAQSLGLPENEIHLINGSGLGVDNRISPRAVVAMYQAIDRDLEGETLSLSDLFPVAGRDKRGTMIDRNMPKGVVAKTGTLNQVSALAGMIPTSDHGDVWFAVINNGTWDVRGYRRQQDEFLNRLDDHWQLMPLSSMLIDISKDYFGNPKRIEVSTNAPEAKPVSIQNSPPST